MSYSWSIIISQDSDGALAFTPDVPGAKVGQPLGVVSGDNVTWNNQTNEVIKLLPLPPAKPTLFPFESIPAGSASDPIFLVTDTVQYSGSIVAAKPHTTPKAKPTRPDTVAWIVVVPQK